MRTVLLSDLSVITTPEQFFSVDKILFVECISFPSTLPAEFLQYMATHPDVIHFRSSLYYPIVMKGAPQNLFLNATQGVPVDYGNGHRGIYSFGKDLIACLRDRLIFDLSPLKLKQGEGIKLGDSKSTLVDRFIRPFVNS